MPPFLVPREVPVEHVLAAVPAQRMGLAVVGPGDEPVQRHRHIDHHLRHGEPPRSYDDPVGPKPTVAKGLRRAFPWTGRPRSRLIRRGWPPTPPGSSCSPVWASSRARGPSATIPTTGPPARRRTGVRREMSVVQAVPAPAVPPDQPARQAPPARPPRAAAARRAAATPAPPAPLRRASPARRAPPAPRDRRAPRAPPERQAPQAAAA